MPPHVHVVLKTNAPDHWPTITIPQRPDLPGFGYRLVTGFEKAGLSTKVARDTGEWVFPGGLLRVIRVREGDETYGILTYDEPGPKANSLFAGAKQLLEPHGVRPIWYCPGQIEPAEPANPLVPLPAESFCRVSRGRFRGQICALWWPSDDQPTFTESRARVAVRRAFEALAGIERAVFGVFAVELELPPFDKLILNAAKKREALDTPRDLPVRERLVPAWGPGRQPMVARISAEKGLSFLFPVAKTPVSARDTFLSAFAAYCEYQRSVLRPDDSSASPDPSPVAWWRLLEASIVARERESGTGVDYVGAVSF